MKKPLLLIIFVFIVCLISVLIIIFLERWVTNFFLIPVLESIIIFLGVYFIYKTTNEKVLTISIIFALFFILLENGVYALVIALNMVDLDYKTVLSWRFLYNTIFILIYVPILTFGIKYKDKVLIFFWFLLGVLFHEIFNLIQEVVS